MTHSAEVTRALEVAPAEIRYRRFCLRVVAGPDVDAQAVSAGEEATIGTTAAPFHRP